MTDLRQLQLEVGAWSRLNFPRNEPHHPLMGLTEELGELCEAKAAGSAEVWADVVGYEGRYEVSDLGKVRRSGAAKGTHIGRMLRRQLHHQGYLTVTLLSGTKASARMHFVHRLVAAAFIGPCPEGFEVNHRNGVKSFNSVFNLEYVTHIENQRHAVRMKLLNSRAGEEHPMAKLTADQAAEIRRLHATGDFTHGALGKRFGVSRSSVTLIVGGHIWKEPRIEVSARLEPRPDDPLMDPVMIALGRLMHAHLKGEQGIRHTPEEIAAMKRDAMGDLVVFLCDYAERSGLSLAQSVEEAWAQVKQRDWRKQEATDGESANAS